MRRRTHRELDVFLEQGQVAEIEHESHVQRSRAVSSCSLENSAAAGALSFLAPGADFASGVLGLVLATAILLPGQNGLITP